MYYPFLRGKRHELSALRKTAPIVKNQKLLPIIEPVKKANKPLLDTIKVLNKYHISPSIIINPIEGEMKGQNNSNIYLELKKENVDFIPCIAFSTNTMQKATTLVNDFINKAIPFSTYFKDEPVQNCNHITNASIFNSIRITTNCTNQFVNSTPNIVTIADSFYAQDRNADYPQTEYVFSDAHIQYRTLPNCQGFGDFQIVGEKYSEHGGPARAVALHTTYIQPQNRNLLTIKHCVSTVDNGTTSNTAAKFLEALDDLINFANKSPAIDQTTIGFKAFKDLHRRRHFPNLGPAKENAIMHHIETITNFL